MKDFNNSLKEPSKRHTCIVQLIGHTFDVEGVQVFLSPIGRKYESLTLLRLLTRLEYDLKKNSKYSSMLVICVIICQKF